MPIRPSPPKAIYGMVLEPPKPRIVLGVLGFRVLGFRVLGLGFWGFRVLGLGFREVLGLGIRGRGFGVKGLGFRLLGTPKTTSTLRKGRHTRRMPYGASATASPNCLKSAQAIVVARRLRQSTASVLPSDLGLRVHEAVSPYMLFEASSRPVEIG